MVKQFKADPNVVHVSSNETYIWAQKTYGGQWATRHVAAKRLAIHMDAAGTIQKILINGMENPRGLDKETMKDVMRIFQEKRQ